MRNLASLLACGLLASVLGAADGPVPIAETQRRIVADYQRLVADTPTVAGRLAANRLAMDAYRHLLAQAELVKDPTADDLRAIGACHEALGDPEKALAAYRRSLAKQPTAAVYLAVAGALLAKKLDEAEASFAQAAKLQPGHPDLMPFQQRLGAACQREGRWAEAVRHYEPYLAYTKVLADRAPGNAALARVHASTGKQLDRLRRFAGMVGQPAAKLEVQDWVQGTPATLADLKGKVVVVDFFAVWSPPSRKRLDAVKLLLEKHGKSGVEAVSLGLAYQYRYDADKDQATFVKDLKPADEKQSLQGYAKKHGIAHRLGFVPQTVLDEYGVTTLPQTVVVGRDGKVRHIQLAADDADQKLEEAVRTALAK